MLAYIPAPWIRHGMGKPMGKIHPPGHRRSWSWPGSRLRPCQRPLNNTPPDVPGVPLSTSQKGPSEWIKFTKTGKTWGRNMGKNEFTSEKC